MRVSSTPSLVVPQFLFSFKTSDFICIGHNHQAIGDQPQPIHVSICSYFFLSGSSGFGMPILRSYWVPKPIYYDENPADRNGGKDLDQTPLA
ncbi:hypothetical protein Hypma_005572 [Hypsizygus marmoreus]|uniref:Uncharacterized protein n=1 Tax=Hypsizygus marmoreus TaxID=39966 RepID=A0A369K4B8_HYPMA|nr:hypothetical protein Hypma_005572 [Hypsizygus marmoreus]